MNCNFFIHRFLLILKFCQEKQNVIAKNKIRLVHRYSTIYVVLSHTYGVYYSLWYTYALPHLSLYKYFLFGLLLIQSLSSTLQWPCYLDVPILLDLKMIDIFLANIMSVSQKSLEYDSTSEISAIRVINKVNIFNK